MRISYVVPFDLTDDSGGKQHTIKYASAWRRRGHEVEVLGRGRGPDVEGFARGGPDLAAPLLGDAVWNLAAAARVLLRRRSPDAYYVRLLALDLVPLAARLRRVPVVLEANDVPPSATLAQTSRAGWRRGAARVASPLLRAVERMNFRLADAVVTTTPRFDPRAAPYRVPPERVAFGEFGFDPDAYPPLPRGEARAKLGLPADAPVVALVGTLLPWLGLDTLIDAAPAVLARHPRTRFVAIGGEDRVSGRLGYADAARAQMARAGVAHAFDLVGPKPRSEVPLWLLAADVCVCPTRPERAGFTPIKLLEYMAAGRPVAASDLPAIREHVLASGGGVLFEAGSGDDLARAVAGLLDDPAGAARMGEAGRAYVRERYTWDAVAGHVADFVERAAERVRRG